jgi:peptidoglycan/LPS O-acetylase OafA/YrhL
MIKADPNVVWYRRLRILYLACVIVTIAVTAFIYLTSTTSTTFGVWSLIAPFFILFSFFSFIHQWRYWKLFEQRRIRAALYDLREDLPKGEPKD